MGRDRNGVELVKQGAIGKPVLFQANSLSPMAFRGDFLNENWRGKRAQSGGGMLLEAGVHLVYTAESVFGRIRQVSAQTILPEDDGRDVEDGALLTGEFDSGARLTLSLHRGAGILDDRQMIVGTDGAIVINAVEAGDTLRRPVLEIYQRGSRSWELPHAIPDWEETFGRLIEQFVTCVLDREEPQVSAADGLSAIAVIEAAYESARTGQRVVVSR